MVTLKNIKYKDGNSAKLHAIKIYKEITGNSLIVSKKFVEDAVEFGTEVFENDFIGRTMGLEAFDCDIIEENYSYHDDEDDEPSPETKEALEWYENQLSFIKDRIDLIVAAKQKEMIPRG